MMKIHVNTLNSRIVTDNPKLLNALCELYSFRVPGSEYSTAYKRRNWDGKIRFIDKKGMFKTGLLSRVLADLKKIECEPDIEYIGDNSKEELNDPTIEGFTFRDYQDELINLALTEKRGVIKSPTGSGKTLIMAGLVQALRGRKMVLLFNAKQLLKQSYEFLTKSCGIENVGLNFGEGYLHGDIMLSTVQSIDKILETHLEEAEVIMVDECHEFASGKTTLAAIRSFPKATYRIGFTATPPSDPIPQHNLEGALGRVLSVVDTASLVDKGTLAKPVIQMINRSYNASGQDEDMGYIDVYENYIVNNDLRNKVIREIVEDIRNKNDKARVLILVKSLEHGRILQDLLGSSEFLEGANDLGERYRIISDFIQAENSSVLIGTKILQTGINIEQITHFINARGMKSEIATLQALGRALRTHESKKEAFVYDFLDKEKYLKDHSTSRKKHYENEGHTVNVL